MTNFVYTVGIPDAPNDPSADQPNMKVNNDSNDGIWKIDHYGFRNNNGGYHKQTTYPLTKTVSGNPNQLSTVYADQGVDSTAVSQLFYKNFQGTFPLSMVRAFGTFPAVPGAGVTNATSYYNINPAISFTGGDYTVVLAANATSSDEITVLLTLSDSSPAHVRLRWSYTAPNLLIKYTSTSKISFVVLQI